MSFVVIMALSNGRAAEGFVSRRKVETNGKGRADRLPLSDDYPGWLDDFFVVFFSQSDDTKSPCLMLSAVKCPDLM